VSLHVRTSLESLTKKKPKGKEKCDDPWLLRRKSARMRPGTDAKSERGKIERKKKREISILTCVGDDSPGLTSLRGRDLESLPLSGAEKEARKKGGGGGSNYRVSRNGGQKKKRKNKGIIVGDSVYGFFPNWIRLVASKGGWRREEGEEGARKSERQGFVCDKRPLGHPSRICGAHCRMLKEG